MEELEFEPEDNYENKCGEIFLTLNGEILVLCTLCDRKYKSFQTYTDHLVTEHYDISSLGDNAETTEIVEEQELFYETYLESDSELSQVTSVDSTLLETELSLDNTYQESTSISDQFKAGEKESVHLQNDESIHTGVIGNNSEGQLKVKKEQQKHNNAELIGERRFKCTMCDFCCKDKSNLLGHMRRHSNRKPHQCSECQKEFYTRTELNSHYRRHTGERPFLCTDCGLTFFTAGLLSSHMKRHKNLREKECAFCQKSFFDTATLEAHTRVHTGIRPFKCKLCDSRFKRRNALMSHIKMHENKREYQCEFCPARFNQKCNLNAHRKSKHLLAVNASAEISLEQFFFGNDTNL